MSKFHSLKIKDIRQETKDAVSISFEIPENLKKDYKYLPGQYLTLKVDVKGESLHRSYSLCSNPFADNEHRIAIKRVVNGRVSTFLTREAKVGDTIEVMTPMGNFKAEIDANNEKHYYLFGAGSGITPLYSILKAVMTNEPKSKVSLAYGNFNSDSVIFKDEMNTLQKEYSGRLEITHVFDNPKKSGGFLGFGKKAQEELPFVEGRIDQVFVAKTLEGKDLTNTEFYTCGPTGLMKAVENSLKRLNVSEDKINV